MEKQRELNLIVAETAGGSAFLGDCDLKIDEANEKIYSSRVLQMFDALAIARATMVNQQTGAPAPVSFLGTIHFCALEPVRRLHITPAYHYWVSEQSVDTQTTIIAEYKAYLAAIRHAKDQQSNFISTASPNDMRNIEQLAQGMGVSKENAVKSFLQGGIDHKIRSGKLQ